MPLTIIMRTVALLVAVSPAVAATIHVPGDYTTVGAALSAALAGDVVQLAPGTYYEHSLTMPSGVTLRGNPADPASTLIDAQQLGRVLTCNGSSPSTIIEGLTIAHGRYDAPYPNGLGGGVACFAASPQIRQCILQGNTSSSAGGALYLSGSSPEVVETSFHANSSGYAGAAAVTNSSQPTFEDCEFVGNTASVVGGAVDNAWWSHATYLRCSFVGNHGEHGGGAFNAYFSSPSLSLCTFFDNSAGTLQHGGAHLLCDQGSSPTVTNSIVAFGRVREAVLCKAGGTVTFACSNIFGSEGGDWVGSIAGQLGVNGNVSLDPLFCDAAGGVLSLATTSPCAPSQSEESCGLIGAFPASCSAGPSMVSVGLTGIANGLLQADPTQGLALPDTLLGSHVLGDVPFWMPAASPNFWHSHLASGGDPRVVDVPVGVLGVARVHALIGTYWGVPGPASYAAVEFFGSGGAYYRVDLLGDDDIRDYNQGSGTNTINGVTTVQVAAYQAFGDGQRLDKMAIQLPAAFQDQRLTSVRFTDNGAEMTQRLFVAGVTCELASVPALFASTSAVADAGHATGTSWLDLDDDGDLDAHVLRAVGEVDISYPNDGLEVQPGGPAPAPLADPGNGQGMDWGDYDNDGDLDVYVVNSDGPNRLYRNDGAGIFTDATSPPLDHGTFDAGATWVDFDRDGLLDLFLTTSFQPKCLYRNLGGGAFADVTPPALATTAQSSGAAWGDYDNDGDPDVYLSVVAGPNALLRNDGGSSFANVTTPPLNDAGTGQGAAWGDYDNDGDLDLYLCNFGQPNRLFRNDGGGSFVDVATGPLADANQGQSGTWADFDNDRDLDLVVTNFGQPSYVLRNDGGNAFSPVATVGETEQSLGAAWGDYDEDGDEDLFIANYGSADRLYRNDQATGNSWLDIELVGTPSNRSAHGARVVLVDFGTGTTQVREHGSNHGFWSVNAPVVHFGLGAASQADAVVVRWPSGAQEIFEDVAANQRITIVEGGGIVGAPVAAPAVALSVRTHPNPFRGATGFYLSGPRASRATIRIFDVHGRLVRTLAGEAPGTLSWDGLNGDGHPVPSGVYFYRVRVGNADGAGKLVRTR